MQAYTPPREEELSGLCRTIRRAGAEKGLDPETEALLKMLEKPPYEDEADRIIRELNEQNREEPSAPSSPTNSIPREKGKLDDGFMKREMRSLKEDKRPQSRSSHNGDKHAPSEEEVKRGRRSAFAIMLVTFSAVLVAGAAFIINGYDSGQSEEIPETPASLCDAGVTGYTLGIDGQYLAIYYNGALQQALDFPVAQLTDYDREMLQNGIPLEDEQALRRAIEDYTS